MSGPVDMTLLPEPALHAAARPIERPLLRVKNLTVDFGQAGGSVRAVDDLSFALYPDQTLAVVGESGCGKSITALSILRLAPRAGRIAGGEILFEDRDLAALGDKEIRRVRGSEIAMIFQEPMTSLNPLMPIGRQISESVRIHKRFDHSAARALALTMLQLVEMPEPERRLSQYPHELSGGMRQRAMIAMALACQPKILIADEPTTALDVTIEAQILDLLRDVRQRTNMAILLVTHDFGVVAEMADRVVVMYAGRKVEEGAVREILRRPRHPYTRALLASAPRLGSSAQTDKPGRLNEIPGAVPLMRAGARGCTFAPRCDFAMPCCQIETPPFVIHDDHGAACWAMPPPPGGGSPA